MKVDEATVRHVARLARIKVSGQEAASLQRKDVAKAVDKSTEAVI